MLAENAEVCLAENAGFQPLLGDGKASAMAPLVGEENAAMADAIPPVLQAGKTQQWLKTQQCWWLKKRSNGEGETC